MGNEEKSRIKYEKPEAQRLTTTKAYGECMTGSGDDTCSSGSSALSLCSTGNSPPIA